MVLSTLEQVLQLESEGKLLGPFDISDELYHDSECPGLSRSTLMKAEGTPEQFTFDMEKTFNPSKDVLLGLGLHGLMLQPEEFEKKYSWCPHSNGTKKANEYKALHGENKHYFSKTDWGHVGGMAKKLKSLPKASGLLSGYYEKAFFWVEEVELTELDKDTGEIAVVETVKVLCKCKPDSIHPQFGSVVDLKKTKDASKGPRGFISSVFEFNYDVQNAFYMDGIQKSIEQGGMGGMDFKPLEYFIFVAIEAKPPYSHGYFQLLPEHIQEGRDHYKYLLQRFIRYSRTDAKLMTGSYTNERIIKLKPSAYMFRNRD
jgi:exodeoxyribonuclease VIII